MERTVALLSVLALIGFSVSAFAAGFALLQQSVKVLGAAFSGSAAVAEDLVMFILNRPA